MYNVYTSNTSLHLRFAKRSGLTVVPWCASWPNFSRPNDAFEEAKLCQVTYTLWPKGEGPNQANVHIHHYTSVYEGILLKWNDAQYNSMFASEDILYIMTCWHLNGKVKTWQKSKSSSDIQWYSINLHIFIQKTIWSSATWAASSFCSAAKARHFGCHQVLLFFQVLYVTAESLRSLQGSRTTLLARVPTRWEVKRWDVYKNCPENLQQYVPTGKGASRFIRLTWIKIIYTPNCQRLAFFCDFVSIPTGGAFW